jgi:3-phosphoshikimate 1-carboxyvinyltransferase
MTVACLRARGVEVSQPEDNFWVVEAGEIHGKEVVIEPDLSNAGPFLAAAMVTGGTVTVKNWPIETTQVGKHFVDILQQMGAQISFSGKDLVIQGIGKIKGIDIDLSIGGELAPVIIALAVLADTPSRITGIAHLRGHETNRLLALTTEINKIGGNAKELEDGIEIIPTENLHGATWETYADHRMATAAAIIGLRVPNITVSDVSVVSKTMPNFVAMWSELIGAN